jgi:Tfp pilus assembly protein PilF
LRRAVGTAVLALGLFVAATSAAQSTSPVDTLAEARRLRDASDYAAAAALLAPYVAAHPDDPGTARFAALMAYWSKDFGAARSIYAAAMERHPTAPDVRVDYAQFLMEIGETARAREVIAPLVETGSRILPETRRALTQLGTLEYWRGDFSRARKLFIEKLKIDSTDADARRQLREIELASAAWVRIGGAGWHDDQPIDHAALEAEAGWFATPLTPISIRAGSIRYGFDDQSETVSRAEATFATFAAQARTDLSITAGVLTRTFVDESDWTARVSLGFRLPRHVALEARFERAPYLNTQTSLASTIMTETVEAALRWRGPSGWMADATARRESFADDNFITTGYVWLLAPVARRSRGEIHLGYSFSAQAAEHNRFVPRGDDLDFPPGRPPETVRGVYSPYYTPRDLRVHSALMSATARPSARWSLSGSGTLGVHARDDAPVFIFVAQPPNADLRRTYYRREFTPWNVRGAIEGAATDAVRLALTAEHGNGAFYSFTTVGVRMTYTFVAAARRRADRY